MKPILHWLKQVAVAIDQLLNTIFGGWADETFSARCYRKGTSPGWRKIRWCVDMLLLPFDGPAHCRASYESEQQRLQYPPAYRDTK